MRSCIINVTSRGEIIPNTIMKTVKYIGNMSGCNLYTQMPYGSTYWYDHMFRFLVPRVTFQTTLIPCSKCFPNTKKNKLGNCISIRKQTQSKQVNEGCCYLRKDERHWKILLVCSEAR